MLCEVDTKVLLYSWLVLFHYLKWGKAFAFLDHTMMQCLGQWTGKPGARGASALR